MIDVRILALRLREYFPLKPYLNQLASEQLKNVRSYSTLRGLLNYACYDTSADCTAAFADRKA